MTSEATINKLKAQRGGLKTSITKLIGKIDEVLLKSDVEGLEIALVQLIEKEKQIVGLDNSIQNELEDVKLIQSDVESSQDYRDKIILYKMKIDKALKNLLKVNIANTESASISALNTSRNSEAQVKIKLPKIHIEKFDGNPENFQEFWSQFKNAIHENSNLNSIDKFTYLKSLLKSSAQHAIKGLSLSEKNYEIAVKILVDRYGKKEILIRSHINNLLNLSPVRNASNLKDLRDLYDTCEIQIRSLEALDIELESYGNLLFPIITKLIPDNLVLNYNREYKNETDAWNVVKLLEYLKTEIEIRERTVSFHRKDPDSYVHYSPKTRNEKEFSNKGKNNFFKRNNNDKHPSAAALNVVSNGNKCIFCSLNDHKTEDCALSVADKKQSLLRQGRCFNCLLKFHVVKKCIKEPACIKCKRKHSQYICDKLSETESETPKNETIVSSIAENRSSNRDILLQTATVIVENRNKMSEALILFDLGSQRTFIESELANKLKLKIIGKETIRIFPFGSTEPQKEIINRVEVNLRNIHDPTKRISIEALCTKTISDAFIHSPGRKIRQTCLVNNMQLADDSFQDRDSSRRKVQILLGADVYWDIVSGHVTRLPNSIVGMNSLFGWILSGSSNLENKTQISERLECTKMLNLIVESSCEENSDLILQNFWKLDAIGIDNEKKDLSNYENEIILQDFKKNIKYQNSRYKVKLPWNENVEKLENNYDIAKYRLGNLVKRFNKDNYFYERYREVISKQISEGIVEQINIKEKTESIVGREYYMPHQAIIRDNKSTTKFRIVFDASSHGINKLSLNDCLHSGPNLNPDSLELLLNFRNKAVALTADIEQAFLQILLDESDRNAVRFLWVENDNKMGHFETKIFRMTRVLFGATPSPFLLAATLKHHIKKYEREYPLAYQILNSQLFVDDLISGLENENQSFEIYKQIKEILREGGFNMRKWKTNSEILQKELNEAENYSESLNDFSKVLGYIWDSNNDTLKLESEFVKINDQSNQFNPLTKRLLLKIASKIYDPIGFITPFTLRPKILLQDIWTRKLKWDDPLPFDIIKDWTKWCEELEELSSFEIPRFYFKGANQNEEIQLHCFVDASNKAYGAILYIRYTDYEGRIQISFVCSKSRVSPLQKLTLPRLELLSAVIGSRLYEYVKKSLPDVKDCPVRFWSDSMIVLHWIRGNSRKLKTFVQNRVTEIRAKTDVSNWSHCPGSQNPADVLTRGENLRSLLDSETWWQGPNWLRESEDCWPRENQEINVIENDEEIKKSATFIVDAKTEDIINIERFGNLTKPLRIIAWIKRFIYNVKNKKNRRIGTLTSEELQIAENFWIKKTQEDHFKEELEALKNGNEITSYSKLKNFTVVLDENNVVRLKSRLQYADISYDTACPILLPDRCHFTDLLIRSSHERLGHAGVSDTLTDIRERFWIIRGRQRIKSNIYNSNFCKKFQVKRVFTQDAAPLSPDHITKIHPFEVIGVDYAGPLYVKCEEGTKRGLFYFSLVLSQHHFI